MTERWQAGLDPFGRMKQPLTVLTTYTLPANVVYQIAWTTTPSNRHHNAEVGVGFDHDGGRCGGGNPTCTRRL